MNPPALASFFKVQIIDLVQIAPVPSKTPKTLSDSQARGLLPERESLPTISPAISAQAMVGRPRRMTRTRMGVFRGRGSG